MVKFISVSCVLLFFMVEENKPSCLTEVLSSALHSGLCVTHHVDGFGSWAVFFIFLFTVLLKFQKKVTVGGVNISKALNGSWSSLMHIFRNVSLCCVCLVLVFYRLLDSFVYCSVLIKTHSFSSVLRPWFGHYWTHFLKTSRNIWPFLYRKATNMPE